MAFWGVEIKPGKPYTHQYDDTRGRLHVSQAVLGFGQSVKKSVVQCNVGDNSPVLLCSLLPERTESCLLDLEFEEDDEVVFSIVGPRSVHLTGYYMGPGRGYDQDGDETDSYGEDIAETETDQSSEYDTEDEYEGDFIDDSDIEMFPTSPRANSGVRIEEIVDDEKPANSIPNGKHLKKSHRPSESDDDDGGYQNQLVVKGAGTPVFDSEDEDGFPVSHSSKSRDIVENADAKENLDPKMDEAGEMKKKKKKKIGKDDNSNQTTCLKRKIDAIDQNDDIERGTKQLSDPSEASDEAVGGKGGKSKKKKKEKVGKKIPAAEVNALTVDNEDKCIEDGRQAVDNSHSHASDGHKPSLEDSKIDNVDGDLAIGNETMEDLPNDNHSAAKKKKTKKKKSKTHDSDTTATNGLESGKAAELKSNLVKASTEQKEVRPVKKRTFSNGLVIEELSMGKPDGKRACPGNKVSVYYIGRLEKNGEIFDSNIHQRPFKFRLGISQVIKGWDVGVNGMRIGDKRRLVIPPSMGYGSKAVGKIPPGSWLVFDVELVDVL